jgi:hypothetical protein
MQVMKFDLSDEQAAALTKELSDIIENDRWPFSPRIWMLKSILAKLRPEPVLQPLSPLKHHEPPRATAARRRRAGR